MDQRVRDCRGAGGEEGPGREGEMEGKLLWAVSWR